MGICKCRKRTDLFCFVHKKAVCESCIATEHKTCVIKTYVEWLTDSEYENVSCGICKGELSDENVLRLTCLDLFHPECIDVYASSLPAHTAKAGYLCPLCSKALFPSDNSSPIAQELTKHLAQAAWSNTLVTGKILDSITSPPPPQQDQKDNVSANIDNSDHDTKQQSQSNSSSMESLSSPPSKRSTAVEVTNVNSESVVGIASRKPQTKEYVINVNDEDDDKYRKRSFTQLLTALGFIKPSSKSVKISKARIRLDTRRMLIIIALISCLITVIVLGSQMTSESASVNTTDS